MSDVKREYLEKSMNDSINPFDTILENPKYPLARIYRKSFWAGIGDTYDVLAGNHFRNTPGERTHWGILDLLIFPLVSQWLWRIACPSLQLTDYPSRTNDTLPGTLPLFFRVVAGIAGVLLETVRTILAISLTILFLPFIALVHVFTASKAKELRNSALNVNISLINRNNEKQEILTSLDNLLNSRISSRLGLDDIITTSEKNKYMLDPMGKCETNFRLFKPGDDSKAIEAIEAFDALNIGAARFEN